MREWHNPLQRQMNPGDHIRAVLDDGSIRTGIARDFYALGEEPVLYQLIEEDPFLGRQNLEQPVRPPETLLPPKLDLLLETLLPPETDLPPPLPRPGRHLVRMTCVDPATMQTHVWIEDCRWRWVALLHVWLARIPSGGQYVIHAELVDPL